MIKNKHIKLLVLPELFPDSESDGKGLFIEDYLASVESLKPSVLYIRLLGKKKGIANEIFKNKFNVRRYNVTDKKPRIILKPFKYVTWFVKGVQLGKTYSDINLIHAHGVILTGTLAYLISKKLKIPFIVTEHTGPYSRILNSFLKRQISKFIFSKAAKILVVSQHQKNEVLKLGIPEEKVAVSYNPINTNTFKMKSITNSKNIVFVSRLDEFKGGLRTLKAFHKIANDFSDYHLTIVGDGEELEMLKKHIIMNKLDGRVTLKGALTKLQIADVLRESNFFVFPSRHETFGIVAAEALSCGLPVVCTNQTAPKEFINDENGILVNPDNIDEIANAMSQLIMSRGNYSAEIIHSQIKERFGLENFGKYLIGVYQAALS